MAVTNLTITTGNVAVEDANTALQSVQYGETVTKGQPVYRKASDGLYYKTDANVDAASAAARGIVYVDGSTNDYGVIVTAGKMDVGATLVKGRAYAVSDTAGSICLYDDGYVGTSGVFVTQLGIALDTDQLDVRIIATATSM